MDNITTRESHGSRTSVESERCYDELVTPTLTARPVVLLTPLQYHWCGDSDAVHKDTADNSKHKQLSTKQNDSPDPQETCSSQKTGVYPMRCYNWS